MDFDDYFKMRSVEQMDERKEHSDSWSRNLPVWAIVIFLVILAWFWYVHKTGQDKADLAAVVQSTVSRVDSLETVATAQGNDIKELNKVATATTQAQADFQYTASENLKMLNRATYVPRGTNGRGSDCNGGSPRFVKSSKYCLEDSSLQEIDTCG